MKDIKDVPGLGSILSSNGDLSKLKEFLENLPKSDQEGTLQSPLESVIGISFGKTLISAEDILRLREFLEHLSVSELDKIVMKQTQCITEQYLLVNRNGSGCIRIFIDGTEETLNNNRFKSVGYSFYREKTFSGDLNKTVNYCSKSYWTCSCTNNFIHHLNQSQCKRCGVDNSKDTKRHKPIEELIID